MSAATSEVEALRARIKALEAEQRWRVQLMETVPAVMMRISLEGVIEYINRILPGFPDPRGMSIYTFAPADQHALMRDAIARVATTLQSTSYESIVNGPDGSRQWFLTTLGPVLEGARLIGLSMVSTDASRLREAETRLDESRVKTQLALDAGDMGIWRWDMQTDLVEWDEKLTAMFGLRPEEAPRTVAQYLALVPDDQKEAMGLHIQNALEAGHYSAFELRADRPQGTRWFILKGGMLRDAAGKITGLLGGVIDITERRHIEERLRQGQKLEAVGQLAAGVAHNFNNMLAVILPSLELLKAAPDHQDPALLDDALTSATNAAQLVQQLMVFSRIEPATGQRTEPLSEVIQRAVKLCGQTFERRIELRLGPLDATRRVGVDSAPMEQALMNLLLNARDALPPGGTRSAQIELSATELTGEELRARHPGIEGRWVELQVRDTGEGMSAATRARMLEPFFTTKGAGKGTGLGLSTAWATVRAHRGFLDCVSEPGQGTTFSLLLPAQDAPVATPGSRARPATTVGEGRTVLIVDDQEAVRRAHAALLRASGFTVLTAASGAEALSAAASGPVDAVILDYSMPGLSAEDTLVALREGRPRLPVVCLSGMGAVLDGATAQLLKPVSQEALVRALVQAIGAG